MNGSIGGPRTSSLVRTFALAVACLSATGCDRAAEGDGERLARAYCAACHAFPEPGLLDKESWNAGVLPEMGPRLGVNTDSSFAGRDRNPHMMVLKDSASEESWAKIVRYYREAAPDSLRYHTLPAEPRVDPDLFATRAFDPRMQSSAIITLLETDTTSKRVFVGEAGSNSVRIFDWERRLLSSISLGSPP